MASGRLHCVWQSVTMSLFHLFQVPLLSAYKQTARVLFPALPKWTVWPWSHLKPEVRALIFLPPRHITMTTDIEITPSPGEKKKPGWHHTVALLWYMRRAGFIQASRPRMSIHPPEEERSGWTERGGGRGFGQRAVMQIQNLNSPAGKRKVTESFILKIANKSVRN